MVSEHLYVNYYYLKIFEIKFQSTKLYLTPFKVILINNRLKILCCKFFCVFVKFIICIKIVKFCMFLIVCLFYVFYSLSS